MSEVSLAERPSYGKMSVPRSRTKPSRNYSRRAGAAFQNSFLNLIELFDEDEVLDWKTLAAYGVDLRLLYGSEPAAYLEAARPNGRVSGGYHENGIRSITLLWRVAELLEIEHEVEDRLNGDGSFGALKTAVVGVIDGFHTQPFA
ncbi:hypothetical protein [Novipirellula artificiosorum]|uniref:Uncharacterized protein n=1 Tax=Novipirellula artificiosorum TaxID=2528016 RepID=A0A5C6DAL8_9BACT|nr:hypothetical protein [Novipirellula artificiosorum]TWU32286.1 hypothetical protein Poly41_57720 [Novipirellula artificiosorum]